MGAGGVGHRCAGAGGRGWLAPTVCRGSGAELTAPARWGRNNPRAGGRGGRWAESACGVGSRHGMALRRNRHAAGAVLFLGVLSVDFPRDRGGVQQVRRAAACTAILALCLTVGCGRAVPTGPGGSAAGTASPLTATPSAAAAPSASVPLPSIPGPTDQATLVSPPPAAGPVGLTAITSVSPAAGWAVGARCSGSPPACTGVVLATSDGGGRWAPLPAPPIGLDGVQFLSTRQGWVWGARGAYATSDGGRAWSRLPVPATPVSELGFTDARDGWLLSLATAGCTSRGCGAAVYATADGGHTWRLLARNAGPGATSAGANLPWRVFRGGGFLGGGHGWLFAADPGALYTTTDGGSRWTQSWLAGEGQAAGFAGPTAGWMATNGCGGPVCSGRRRTDYADLYQSGDAGATWTRVASVDQFVTALTPLPSAVWLLAQPPNGTPRCADRSCATETAVVSAGGAPVFHPVHGAALLALAASGPRQAWAVGSLRSPGDAILGTDDGGASWQVLWQAASQYSPGASWGFTGPRAGWALGAQTDASAVLRTADGGSNWSRTGTLPSPVGYGWAAGFSDASHAWMLTADGDLEASADGGAQWTDLGNPATCGPPVGLGMFTPKDGWLLASGACGSNTLYRTSDGGRTWTALPAPPAPESLRQISFAADGTGWALLNTGSNTAQADFHPERDLATSTDGGRTWRPVADLGPARVGPGTPPTQWVATQVEAVPGGVWVIGWRPNSGPTTGGVFLAARHPAAVAVAGGFALARGMSPQGIDFVSATTGWMLLQGTLYATTDGGRNWRLA